MRLVLVPSGQHGPEKMTLTRPTPLGHVNNSVVAGMQHYMSMSLQSDLRLKAQKLSEAVLLMAFGL